MDPDLGPGLDLQLVSPAFSGVAGVLAARFLR